MITQNKLNELKLITNRWVYLEDGKLRKKRVDRFLKPFKKLMLNKEMIDCLTFPVDINLAIQKICDGVIYDSSNNPRQLTRQESVGLTVYLIGLYDNRRFGIFSLNNYALGGKLLASRLLTVK